jgi:hypothetical protein
MLLPRAEISRSGAMPSAELLLHREEGIDLRLPHSRKDASSCGGMPLTSVSEANRFRCWVDLDENLVLTSASVARRTLI